MKYGKNDKVKLNRDYTITKGTITKGTKGTINSVITTQHAYHVDFNAEFPKVKVPERCLDKA